MAPLNGTLLSMAIEYYSKAVRQGYQALFMEKVIFAPRQKQHSEIIELVIPASLSSLFEIGLIGASHSY
jgi:hypothetical protein